MLLSGDPGGNTKLSSGELLIKEWGRLRRPLSGRDVSEGSSSSREHLRATLIRDGFEKVPRSTDRESGRSSQETGADGEEVGAPDPATAQDRETACLYQPESSSLLNVQLQGFCTSDCSMVPTILPSHCSNLSRAA